MNWTASAFSAQTQPLSVANTHDAPRKPWLDALEACKPLRPLLRLSVPLPMQAGEQSYRDSVRICQTQHCTALHSRKADPTRWSDPHWQWFFGKIINQTPASSAGARHPRGKGRWDGHHRDSSIMSPSVDDGIALEIMESHGSLAASPPDLYPICTGVRCFSTRPLGGGSESASAKIYLVHACLLAVVESA